MDNPIVMHELHSTQQLLHNATVFQFCIFVDLCKNAKGQKSVGLGDLEINPRKFINESV